jgi:uncharacterized protein YqjF (DUF2071 family)
VTDRARTDRNGRRVFLTAEWRFLAILNYAVDPALLQPMVPPGTTLDSFDGASYISLIGFRFLSARVLGVPVPFHSNFEEVNLRFYVRRSDGRENRRGVTFIREIVPRFAIAAIARSVYHENYVSLPMSHRIVRRGGTDREGLGVEYRWRHAGSDCRISVDTRGLPAAVAAGSLEQFITEHYWGYSKTPDGGSIEYEVEHEPWRVWSVQSANFEGDPQELYGPELARILRGRPDSAFLAEGSPVTVYRGHRIDAGSPAGMAAAQ